MTAAPAAPPPGSAPGGGPGPAPARYDVLVEVSLRPGIADPEGATIERALPALGFGGISSVRVGKAFRFSVDGADEGAVRLRVDELCRRFLTNPVIEDARIEVRPGRGPGGAGTPALAPATDGAGEPGAGPAGGGGR